MDQIKITDRAFKFSSVLQIVDKHTLAVFLFLLIKVKIASWCCVLKASGKDNEVMSIDTIDLIFLYQNF